MNAIESKIVDTILGDIVTTTTAAERSPLLSDLYTFLGAVEKRVALAVVPADSVIVTDAEGLVAKLKAAGEDAVAKVKALL